MPDRLESFAEYDQRIRALIAHDEEHDPTRARLLRDMFSSQRVFFHDLLEEITMHGQGVSNLADRVQNHISPQLIDILEAIAAAAAQQTAVLTRLNTQDAMLKATHDGVADIARMLSRQHANERKP